MTRIHDLSRRLPRLNFVVNQEGNFGRVQLVEHGRYETPSHASPFIFDARIRVDTWRMARKACSQMVAATLAAEAARR